MTIIIGYEFGRRQGRDRVRRPVLPGRDAIVVTTFEEWPPAVQGDAVEVDDAARAKAEDIAEGGAPLALHVDIKAEARTAYTAEKAWQSITRVADELDAGLIVVGSHGFNGLGPLVLGSVSHQLAHHAHQPVIAVPTTDAVAARREQTKSGGEEHTHTH